MPDLEVDLSDGRREHLRSFAGRWLVLYFYPKDNTPGCTLEAQDFRDLAAEFDLAGARILGVSRDSLKSHQNFCNKHDLPFALVSDPDETLCRTFDVMREKTLYGRTHIGIERSTFLIDPQQRIIKAWRGVKVAGHAQAVLNALREAS
ncbi:MAG TPA: peroxiredoxin [Chiayiivirga sp.]|nr:peroxiredoxin [Chiayiivirga sp.]